MNSKQIKMKKSSAIHEKLCHGKDVFERMNYLYQASLLVSFQNISLASYYNSILRGCAKKAVLRLDHKLKRSICKICQSPLIPGKTSKIRLISKKRKIIKTICLMCKKTKNIPIKVKQNFWFDQPQAVLEVFDYTLKSKTNSCKDVSRKDTIGKDNIVINSDNNDHKIPKE